MGKLTCTVNLDGLPSDWSVEVISFTPVIPSGNNGGTLSITAPLLLIHGHDIGRGSNYPRVDNCAHDVTKLDMEKHINGARILFLLPRKFLEKNLCENQCASFPFLL